MAVLIFLGCLLGGIAIGLPIAWALLLCGAALMFWLDMFDHALAHVSDESAQRI